MVALGAVLLTQLAAPFPLLPYPLSSSAGPELAQLDPQEAADRLRLVLKVLGTFKSTYLEYKARSASAAPANPWRVQNGALFGRLDAFLARCQDVLELCTTGQEVRGRQRECRVENSRVLGAGGNTCRPGAVHLRLPNAV